MLDLTYAEILALHAGRELDALVASEVLEWTGVCDPGYGCDWGGFPPGVEPFSSPDGTSGFQTLPYLSYDVGAVWEVVRKLVAAPADFGLRYDPSVRFPDGSGSAEGWSAWFGHAPNALAPTEAHAVCLAALLWVKENERKKLGNRR